MEITAKPLAELWAGLFQMLRDPDAPRPDIVAVPSHWTPQLARLGLLMELSALEPAFDPAACPAPLRPHACPEEGKAFSLPWRLEAPALFCRGDILERGGLRPEELASPDAFRRACRSLGKVAGGRALLKGPSGSLRWRDAAPFVWARGGDFFSTEGRALFAREEALRGFEDLFELIAEGALVLSEDSGLPVPGIGEGGCVFELGPAPEGPYADRVVALPFPGGAAPLLWALHLAVPSDCAFPAEAWKRVRSLSPAPPPLPDVRTLPALLLAGTLERILERALERLAVLALGGAYSKQGLQDEVAHAAAEADAVSGQYA
ncbi:MAG TPA: hypothetical protein DCM05_17685 [Elusimicrobia bacterium]|nr:hypothetical protein [Elusimicrobiota bacterium]